MGMEPIDRAVVETYLRMAIHPESLDTFSKAKKYLRKKGISGDILIDYEEVIERIYEEMKSLLDAPPSPPDSKFEPIENSESSPISTDGDRLRNFKSRVPPYTRGVSKLRSCCRSNPADRFCELGRLQTDDRGLSVQQRVWNPIMGRKCETV